MSSFAQYANSKNVTWDTNDDFEDVPDGGYIAKLHKAEVKQSKSSKNWMLALQWKIKEDEENEGQYEGRLAFSNLMFEGKDGWNPWAVKAFFEDLGLELPEFEDMEETMDALVEENNLIEIEIVTENDYTSINAVSIIGPGEDDEEEEEEETSKKSKSKSKGKKSKPEPEEEEDEDDEDDEDEDEEDDESDDDDSDDEDEEEDEEEEDDEALEALQGFLDAYGAEYDEDADVDDLKSIIAEYEFPEEELDEEEKQLLIDNDLSSCIIKPKKKKAAPKGKAKGKKGKK